MKIVMLGIDLGKTLACDAMASWRRAPGSHQLGDRALFRGVVGSVLTDLRGLGRPR
jgi:hypothetical protein